MIEHAALVTLGCSKNLVDSESMVSQLTALGYQMTDDPSCAYIIVVNTCGFLESAVEEALDTILDVAKFKSTGNCRFLVVTGCMVQRYGKKLIDLLPEVDLFLGTSHYHALGKAITAHAGGLTQKLLIGRPSHLSTCDSPRVLSTPAYTAYVKIAEGCSNKCAFCMIPQLRGTYRSRQSDDVTAEIRSLADRGAREINLIAQDTTAFGSDRGSNDALVKLLRRVEEIKGLRWVRILYAYPDKVSSELLETMACSRVIVPYLDIPLQHCVPAILKSMRRTVDTRTVQSPERMVENIRERVPGIALRTSLMVGFPGESESDFEELVRFVEHAEFEHLGVFAFSPERGARAAAYPGQVDPAVREHRRDTLLQIQREISAKKLRGLVGRTLPVLIEGPHSETDLLLSGRLATQAPEVDGSVIITSGNSSAGVISLARVTASHDYDLEAEILPGPE